MCLLTFFPPEVMPNVERLRTGTYVNDDGHGWALVDMANEKIIIGRGLDSEKMIEEFAVARAAYPDGPALFHSRMATDGVVGTFNVHPFTVGRDPRTVLAHNGIMPMRPSRDDPRSDTRLVAESLIPQQYRGLRGRRQRLRFERWMGRYNKVVLLTVDHRFRDRAYILNEDQGIWDAGVWYSNDGYQPWTRRYSTTHVYASFIGGHDEGGESSTYEEWWEARLREDRYCPGCKGYLESLDTDCPWCGLCLDCYNGLDSCDCYTPASASTQLVIPRRWSTDYSSSTNA
jgi:predicted glutamine amidotransferase